MTEQQKARIVELAQAAFRDRQHALTCRHNDNLVAALTRAERASAEAFRIAQSN